MEEQSHIRGVIIQQELSQLKILIRLILNYHNSQMTVVLSRQVVVVNMQRLQGVQIQLHGRTLQENLI